MSVNTENLEPAVAEFWTRWHEIVASGERDAFAPLLADGISIGAPPYWDRIEGRDVVAFLLGVILSTIEEFEYHREWVDGRDLALEFTGRVGDKHVQGIDLITLGADGRIEHFDVLMRPLNTIVALREVVAPQMVEFFASQGGAD